MPASPSPPSSLKAEKTVFPSPGASSGRRQLRLCSAPGGSETIGNPGFTGAGFPSFRSFFLFFFQEAQVLWRLLLGSRILCQRHSAASTEGDSPTKSARARAHAQRAALRGPGGRWGRREHHPPRWPRPRPRPEAAGAQNRSPRPGEGRAAWQPLGMQMRGNREETLRSGLFAREEGWEREKKRQIIAHLHCLCRRSSVLRKPQTYLFGSAEEEEGTGGKSLERSRISRRACPDCKL